MRSKSVIRWETRRGTVAVSMVALVLVAALAIPAGAGPGGVTGLTPISGASPYGADCSKDPTLTASGNDYADGEVETMLVVNPVDPRNIAATWIQFPHAAGVIGVSKDAGKTWEQVLVPGLKACTGGGEGGRENAVDPWLSFGPDGVLYFGAMSYDPLQAPMIRRRAIIMSRSDDGGLTWSPKPVTIRSDESVNDKPSITADPFLPQRVYATWSHADPLSARIVIEFSRSDDGGRTWSTPLVTNDDPTPAIQGGAVISVLPDGALLDVYEVQEVSGNKQVAQRSTDGGETWSTPVEIGTVGDTTANDPDSGTASATRGFSPSTAISSDGTVYVAWTDIRSNPTSSTVVLATSRDGGVTWSVGDAAIVPGQAVGASVAVSDHQVGVTWYDDRNDVRGDEAWTTDYWFADSDDGGHTFRETHVGGPFNLRNGAAPPGFGSNWIGDYFGLAGYRNAFVTAFVMTDPPAQIGPSDVFFARLH